jgi:hypothetical protein
MKPVRGVFLVKEYRKASAKAQAVHADAWGDTILGAAHFRDEALHSHRLSVCEIRREPKMLFPCGGPE